MFKEDVLKLKEAIESAVANKIDLTKEVDKDNLTDFGERKKSYYKSEFDMALNRVKANAVELNGLITYDAGNREIINKALGIIPSLDKKDINKLKKNVDELYSLAAKLKFPKEAVLRKFKVPSAVPAEIIDDIKADIDELNRCFSAKCYRSAVILCGRVLETALHRKYYEVTLQDLLEKSPGIGLGNLVLKLKEAKVVVDPGLTNQIHLINQVRVSSVHKQKDAFYPSAAQTEAIILYTLDILEKLFS